MKKSCISIASQSHKYCIKKYNEIYSTLMFFFFFQKAISPFKRQKKFKLEQNQFEVYYENGKSIHSIKRNW